MEESIRNEAHCIPKFTTEQIAALIEEMLSKGYDQMKARVLTTVEAASGKTDIGNNPLGRSIGYALDDAKRVMLDVLTRLVPDITPQMLTEAENVRKRAELEAQTENLFELERDLEYQISHIREKRKARVEKLKAERLLETARMMGPGAIDRAMEVLRHGERTHGTSVNTDH